jgi:hypothetical protein
MKLKFMFSNSFGDRKNSTGRSALLWFIFPALSVWLGTGCLWGLTVRVDPANGAPRLTVNGEPVRARMFWGGPGSSILKAKATWQHIQFEFQAEADASNGTVHFRFGQEPGKVFLDEIQVSDLDTKQDVIPKTDFENGRESLARDWTFWPSGAQNTVGTITVEPREGRNGSSALQIALKNPPNGQWPDFHLYHQTRLQITKQHRYQVSFWMRAEPERKITMAFYRPGQPFVNLGGPPGVFENQIKLAAHDEVNFVSFPIHMPWSRPGVKPDWTAVDSICEKVLRANPKALLLPRMGMDPPHWWREANPSEVMRWENNNTSNGAVVASVKYRQDAAQQLSALVAHLEEKFGENVAGYHPCGQNTGEWFYHETWRTPLNGYAPADLTGWRDWLKKRYDTDAELRKAWHKPDVSRSEVPVPTAQERHAAPAGIFRDPNNEQHLIDWAEFQQQAMSECVLTLAKAARQASHGKKLVVFFYGYVFEFSAVNTGPSVSGHYALRRLLECPDIDVLCSPISYFDRGLGQSAPSMTAAESVGLASKLWLNEDDTHTYLASGTPPGSRDHVTTLEETNQQLVRNVAQEALRNFGTWWMDLGSSGWFNDAGMWSEMTRLKELDLYMLNHPLPFRPQVAAVIDEHTMLHVAAGGSKVTRSGIYEIRHNLGRMGTPYGQYLLDDVVAGKINVPLQIFLNAWVLDTAQRTQLRKTTRGTTRIWCYAPGYYDGYQASLDSMRELTGFTFKQVEGQKAMATPTERGRALGLTQAFGVNDKLKPLFAVTDAKPEEILAVYPDGSAAVALRNAAEGKSLFAGVPGLSSDLLRLAAREAGAHLYAPTDCNVYANGPFLVLHGSQDGSLEINTGNVNPVTDEFSHKTIGNGPKIQLSLKRGETRVLRIRKD